MAAYHEKLHLTGAHLRGDLQECNPPIALPDQPLDSRLLALDIGGTLIKLVYFSDGMLRFVTFETRRLDECLEFIRSKNLVFSNGDGQGQCDGCMTIKIAYFVAKLSGLKKIFFRGTYVCGYETTMDKISRSLKYWSKGQLQTTFLCHEGFMGAVGAFWSYENMGINDVATKEVMKHVLLGAPYIAGSGKSPMLPAGQLHNNGDQMNYKMELERLQRENAELNNKVERLQGENAELKAKLEKLQQGHQG